MWFLRRPIQFLADVSILCAAFFAAYMPAINIQLGDFYFDRALSQLPFVVFLQFSSLYLFGAYTILWRYISIEDIKVFLKAAIVSCSALITLRIILEYTTFDLWQIPVSVILINSVLAFGGLLGLRVLRRFVYEIGDKNIGGRRVKLKQKPALLIGAGRVGATLIKAMAGRADAELEIRGLIDDDPRKKGSSVGGIKVLGSTADLGHLVDELNIEQVVIATDETQGKEIRRILDLCRDVPVKARIVPSLNEIVHGRVSVNRLRDVQIEDLLGRDPVVLDGENLHAFLSDKTIMVTGAGGSIGSELVRQIVNYSPRRILLVERAEYFLFRIGRELALVSGGPEIISLIADVCDEPRVRSILKQYRPDVVFHAAAHKHVPLMETNAAEAIKNNVFGTQTLARIAGETGVGDFVLISTDKAVNPTSIMGASKRIAEVVVQSFNNVYPTKYVAVRFGNVLGSAGSVVPIFREQIQKGEAITVTDPEMTRYFMTIPEASQLVMQAGALGSGGEIFILDMGKPVKIVELAEDMIRLSGLTAYEDIDIVFTGARKGEKLFEELEISGESLVKTRHPKIFIGKIAGYSSGQVNEMITSFAEAVAADDEHEIRRLFNQLLPEASISVEPDSSEDAEPFGQESFFAQPGKYGVAEK